jgi:hypothetical protein
MRMMVMKGFLPLFLLSGFFLAAPIIHYYADVDYTSTATRGGVIAVASVVGLAIVAINDIVALFNFVLFFHTGIEVKVLDILQKFANDSTTSDGDMALAWVGFAVIIVHLLPFFLCDKRMLLVLLGVVGIPVNAAALVYLDSSMLLFVGFSSAVLLGAVLCICYTCSRRCAMLPLLMKTMQNGEWIKCTEYEC